MDAVWSELRSKRGWTNPNSQLNCLMGRISYKGQVDSTPAALQPYRAVWAFGLVAAVFLLFLLPTTVAATPAFCNATGYEREWEYLTCHLGLELWEEGKKSQNIFQRWELRCGLEKGKPPSCTLERTQILFWSKEIGAHVITHRHSTLENTLRVIVFDMQNRRLEFDVIYPGGERMPVVMRLKPRQYKVFLQLL